MSWLDRLLGKEDKKKHMRLDGYEYEIIEALVNISIPPWEIAMALDISETRAAYEVKQAKERIKNGPTKSKQK